MQLSMAALDKDQTGHHNLMMKQAWELLKSWYKVARYSKKGWKRECHETFMTDQWWQWELPTIKKKKMYEEHSLIWLLSLPHPPSLTQSPPNPHPSTTTPQNPFISPPSRPASIGPSRPSLRDKLTFHY